MENNDFLSIKNWAPDDRPREKLMNKGINSLSDAELIAILIGNGTKNESAVNLAKKMLSVVNNNLNELAKLNLSDLKKTKGIGDAKAITIMAAMELGRRRKLSDIIEKKKITSSRDIFELFSAKIGDLPHEEFWIILLNRSNTIIDYHKISQGGISGTVIDIRLILKEAIEKLASALIICHNHPSGNIKPSDADIQITKKLKEAGLYMEINLLDHVVVSDNSFYSFADEGIF